MCMKCGLPILTVHWTDAGAATNEDRLMAKSRRGRILRSVLQTYGVTAQYAALTPGLRVSAIDGDPLLARDIDELWPLVEQIAGASLDPLDPRFTRTESKAG